MGKQPCTSPCSDRAVTVHLTVHRPCTVIGCTVDARWELGVWELTEKRLLPPKLPAYFRRLGLEYERAGNAIKLRIIQAGRISVIEDSTSDNWNGGTFGHDVTIYLPTDLIKHIPLSDQSALGDVFLRDLNACSSIPNEHVNAVHIALADESDADYQSALALNRQASYTPDTVAFWKPGHIRLFVSHRDTHKKDARALADALEQFGISAFVAHDTIAPMSSWQKEIEKGLHTMELMLAFVTTDFHESAWSIGWFGLCFRSLGTSEVMVVVLKIERSVD